MALMIQDVKNPWRATHETNSTSTSFSAKSSTTTEPTGDGVVKSSGSRMKLVFFGTDADNETFDARVIGWRKLYGTDLWVSSHIVTVSCTLSSSLPGVAGETISDTEYQADTITLSSGDPSAEIIQGVSDLIAASLIIYPNGEEKIEVLFDLTGAASANALYTTF